MTPHKHRRKNGITWACDCDEFSKKDQRIRELEESMAKLYRARNNGRIADHVVAEYERLFS